MNIITLNETRSTLIKGLLIQSLPPITKPQQRVLTETIDGRDGDRLTLLGYAAYDKTVQIGLCGYYDVDEVIQYFVDNMSGKVIFSNEPDKYYRYTIVKQIDFERLLRFKQAKVVFHVQPYKYDAGGSDELTAESQAGLTTVSIFNKGNAYSRPLIALYGSGVITFTVNGIGVDVDFSQCDGVCVIDVEGLEAYDGYPGVQGTALANRAVSGDYNTLRLKPGENLLRKTGTGTLTAVQVTLISRWI